MLPSCWRWLTIMNLMTRECGTSSNIPSTLIAFSPSTSETASFCLTANIENYSSNRSSNGRGGVGGYLVLIFKISSSLLNPITLLCRPYKDHCDRTLKKDKISKHKETNVVQRKERRSAVNLILTRDFSNCKLQHCCFVCYSQDHNAMTHPQD